MVIGGMFDCAQVTKLVSSNADWDEDSSPIQNSSKAKHNTRPKSCTGSAGGMWGLASRMLSGSERERCGTIPSRTTCVMIQTVLAVLDKTDQAWC